MFKLKRLQRNDKNDLFSVKEIYENSFPPNERRNFDLIIKLTENKQFNLSAILFDENVIGLLSSWDFNQFIYIEHFAIGKNFRNNGVGSYVLNLFISEHIEKQIILEVDLPTDDISLKRIEFYKRFGFTICKETYIQPPYDKTKEAVPMLLMTKKSIDNSIDFELIKEILYKNVYFVNIN